MVITMLLIVNVSALFHRLGSRNKSDGLHLADKVERETQMSLCVIIKNKCVCKCAPFYLFNCIISVIRFSVN